MSTCISFIPGFYQDRGFIDSIRRLGIALKLINMNSPLPCSPDRPFAQVASKIRSDASPRRYIALPVRSIRIREGKTETDSQRGREGSSFSFHPCTQYPFHPLRASEAHRLSDSKDTRLAWKEDTTRLLLNEPVIKNAATSLDSRRVWWKRRDNWKTPDEWDWKRKKNISKKKRYKL